VPTEVVGAKIVRLSSVVERRAARNARHEPQVPQPSRLDGDRAAVFERGSRSLAWVAGTAAIAASVALATFAPWMVTFGVAVAAAVAWCAWLDRHPEP
jgi:hypothetical protein